MKSFKKILVILLLSLSTSVHAQSKFDCGLSLGYAPTILNFKSLGVIHSFSIGLALQYQFNPDLYAELRPEIVVGSRNQRLTNGGSYQYNMPSLSLPLLAGVKVFSIGNFDFDIVAGVRARYGHIAYTPSGGELVLRHVIPDNQWQKWNCGFVAGISSRDLGSSFAANFALEYCYYLVGRSYGYSMSNLSLCYRYWF